jgi:hypothetical protein
VNIINVIKRIHDAGVVHGGFGVFDVLLSNAKPFIVNFKNASEKVCERRLVIVKGTITPKREQFGCPELYRLCVDLQIWKPRTSFYVFNFDYSELTRPPIQVRSPSRASVFPWKMCPVQRHSQKKFRTTRNPLRSPEQTRCTPPYNTF